MAEDTKAVLQQVLEQARQEFQAQRDSLSILWDEVSQEALGTRAYPGDTREAIEVLYASAKSEFETVRGYIDDTVQRQPAMWEEIGEMFMGRFAEDTTKTQLDLRRDREDWLLKSLSAWLVAVAPPEVSVVPRVWRLRPKGAEVSHISIRLMCHQFTP